MQKTPIAMATAKLPEELGAAFQFSLFDEFHPVWKALKAWQCLRFAIDVAEDAAVEFDRQHDIPQAVDAADLRWTAADADIGNRAEIDAAPDASDVEVRNVVERCPAAGIEPRADGKLALRQV